jgi:hypothetical protein
VNRTITVSPSAGHPRAGRTTVSTGLAYSRNSRFEILTGAAAHVVAAGDGDAPGHHGALPRVDPNLAAAEKVKPSSAELTQQHAQQIDNRARRKPYSRTTHIQSKMACEVGPR